MHRSVWTCTAAGAGPIGIGLILLVALLIERHRYKRILDDPPGPDWQPTGERFIEPGSGTPVEVYNHKLSGKRLYVRFDATRARGS